MTIALTATMEAVSLAILLFTLLQSLPAHILLKIYYLVVVLRIFHSIH